MLLEGMISDIIGYVPIEMFFSSWNFLVFIAPHVFAGMIFVMTNYYLWKLTHEINYWFWVIKDHYIEIINKSNDQSVLVVQNDIPITDFKQFENINNVVPYKEIPKMKKPYTEEPFDGCPIYHPFESNNKLYTADGKLEQMLQIQDDFLYPTLSRYENDLDKKMMDILNTRDVYMPGLQNF